MAKSKIPPGFLNVNKAAGMTAHDVVARLRKISGIKQIGHAGTLDPMARGVLPVALGGACRLLRFLPDDKVYLATVIFGRKTDTDDVEGKIIERSCTIPRVDEIRAVLENFIGEIEQTPPLYSAVHLNGERLYQLARRGESPVNVPKRKVHVFSIELLDYRTGLLSPVSAAEISHGQQSAESGNAITAESRDTAAAAGDELEPAGVEGRLELRIHCSSGTYIRSIARDLGELLSSAACLGALLRERAGLFELNDSCTLEEIKDASEHSRLAAFIEPVENKLPQARIELNEEECRRLKFGQRLKVNSAEILPAKISSNTYHKHGENLSAYVLALEQGKLMAVCNTTKIENTDIAESSIVELQPEVVLAHE